MAITRGPSIVRDGLVLCLDAKDPNSYSGSGSTWSDVSGNDYDTTLTNSPTYNSSGYFDFDGTDQSAVVDSNIISKIQGQTNFTIIILFKMDTTASLRGLMGTLNYSCTRNLGLVANGTSLQFYNDTTTCYSVGLSGYISTGKWIFAAGTYDGLNTKLYAFKDGALSTNSGTGKSGGTVTFTSSFRVMGSNHSDFFTDGKCAFAHMYDRTLSQNEISQNYNALKSRFL